MKITRNLLLLCAFLVSIYACEQDTLDVVTDVLTEEQVEQYLQEYQGDLKIDYVSLEELNAEYAEIGLPPVTLEDLGVSQEAYDAAQTSISEGIESRCDAQYLTLGDYDQNGTLTGFDSYLAHLVIIGSIPKNPNSNRFGLLSTYASQNAGTPNHGGNTLTTYDRTIHAYARLGLICDSGM